MLRAKPVRSIPRFLQVGKIQRGLTNLLASGGHAECTRPGLNSGIILLFHPASVPKTESLGTSEYSSAHSLERCNAIPRHLWKTLNRLAIPPNPRPPDKSSH